MKTEPGECSIDDALAAPVSWFGIRNYQARNFIRDDMSVGDGVLFYHSGCPEPGIVGLAVIDSEPYPDELQFDPENEYFDAKSSKENPLLAHDQREGPLQGARHRARRAPRTPRIGRHARSSTRQPSVDHSGDGGRIPFHHRPSLLTLNSTFPACKGGGAPWIPSSSLNSPCSAPARAFWRGFSASAAAWC